MDNMAANCMLQIYDRILLVLLNLNPSTIIHPCFRRLSHSKVNTDFDIFIFIMGCFRMELDVSMLLEWSIPMYTEEMLLTSNNGIKVGNKNHRKSSFIDIYVHRFTCRQILTKFYVNGTIRGLVNVLWIFSSCSADVTVSLMWQRPKIIYKSINIENHHIWYIYTYIYTHIYSKTLVYWVLILRPDLLGPPFYNSCIYLKITHNIFMVIKLLCIALFFINL